MSTLCLDPLLFPGPLTNVTWNLFFVTTTLTSIGYGANAPDSLLGRLFCMVYISLGIPLYLVTIADLAKFCTEFMNRTYTEYLKLKHRCKEGWARRRKKSLATTGGGLEQLTEEASADVDRVIIAGGEEEVRFGFLGIYFCGYLHFLNLQYLFTTYFFDLSFHFQLVVRPDVNLKLSQRCEPFNGKRFLTIRYPYAFQCSKYMFFVTDVYVY